MPLQDTTPQVILISDETNAVGLAVSGAIPANTPGILMAGVVNNNTASFLKLDSGGNLFITGSVGATGIANVTGSVFVINQTQANPAWVTGSVTSAFSDPAESVTGSAVPSRAIFIAGVDGGGLFRGISTTTTGVVNVTGSQFAFNNTTQPLFVSASGTGMVVTGSVGITGIPTITGSVFVINQTQANPAWVTGSVTSAFSDPAEGVTGSAVPSRGIFVAGVDPGGLLRGVSTTTTGIVNVSGSQFVFNNTTQPLFVSASGTGMVVTGSVGISGVPVVTGSVFVINQTQANPAWITGSVTSQVSVTATNPSVGLTGSAVPVSASYVGGVDSNGLLRGLSTTTAGVLNVTGSTAITGTPTVTGSVFVFNNNVTPLFVTDFEPPTFMVTAENIQIGNNKSMISLLNAAGSTVFVKVKSIIIANVQTASVVGILAQMRLHRISAHSVGTAITPVSFDSSDSLNVAVTARTGATVTEGVFFKKTLLQTNELSGAGGTSTDTLVSLIETQLPFFEEIQDSKAIILRANEGIHIRQATNSTVGTFDLTIVFTVETSV
jgi:hypothetical protein